MHSDESPAVTRRLLRRLAKGRRSFWYWPSAEAPLTRGGQRRRLRPARAASQETARSEAVTDAY